MYCISIRYNYRFIKKRIFTPEFLFFKDKEIIRPSRNHIFLIQGLFKNSFPIDLYKYTNKSSVYRIAMKALAIS